MPDKRRHTAAYDGCTRYYVAHVNCPYCGETIDVFIDQEEVGHQYIEDCQVCCRPITFTISADMNGDLSVSVHDENESF